MRRPRRDNVKIKIDVKQKVINRENYIYVENIIMRQRQNLPRKYLDSKEFIHKHKGSVYYFKDHVIVNMDFLCEGVTYPEEYFEEKLAIIKRCANNLSKINLTLAKNLEVTWNDFERTITI